MSHTIAVIGAACRYPDANDISELWENVLAGRRAFRRMPRQRINLDDYYQESGNNPDTLYCTQAAVLDGYEFDRNRFRIAGSTFRQADLAHWLALEVASDALADAGFSGRRELPRDRTGVLVGNTLTGEFSRARTMRLRWPYVRRVLEASLDATGVVNGARGELLAHFEEHYKAPFPEPDEESLAGGLSNTIAGRICNYFDLHGGGYTVDGACASSLLAVTNACSALAAGDLDLAIVGGVDLSLDPFELVGFARNGALAREEMRVFDKRSQGFFPGEGCGFAVLMRADEARAARHRVYATIRGWGISSDGAGGLTRPTVSGQSRALQRAYERAGFSPRTVSYFEAHGTGTSVGDATELQTLTRVVSEASGELRAPAAVGSIKALIGHTKAAAGIAGVLKAMQVVRHRYIPATAGCDTPHPLLEQSEALRAVTTPEPWPEQAPVRAAVSGMGFGGINAHIVLEGEHKSRRTPRLSVREQRAARSTQDAELLAFDADSTSELLDKITRIRAIAPQLSRAQLADFGAVLASDLRHRPHRAAVVAARGQELAERLDQLIEQLQCGTTELRLGNAINRSLSGSVFAGLAERQPEIGFLFPGQGSPAHLSGGIYRRRFEDTAQLYRRFGLSPELDGVETKVAQPAIVLASLAASEELIRLGVSPSVALGHSLGELSALACGGVLDQRDTLQLATVRGRAMSELGDAGGSMAMLATSAGEARRLIGAMQVVIACYNGERNVVLSGPAGDVEAVVGRARAAGVNAVTLRVSHAFHSPLVCAATEPLKAHLHDVAIAPAQLEVISTITGRTITSQCDVRQLLAQQVTEPVRFTDAVCSAAEKVDLFLEVGPGSTLARLARLNTEVPVISLDASGPSLRGLLDALSAAFVLGAEVDIEALFCDRFTRPADLGWELRPLVNPCEAAPIRPVPLTTPEAEPAAAHEASDGTESEGYDDVPPLEIVRTLVARRAELSAEAVGDGDRMLDDLHLNSIMVAEIVAEAARAMGVTAPAAPTEFANATVSEMAQAVAAGDATGSESQTPYVAGVEDWVRVFRVEPQPSSPNDLAPISTTRADPDGASWQLAGEGLDELAGGLYTLSPGGWLVRTDDAAVALRAAQAAITNNEPSRFVLIHGGEGPTGIARTLHLEAPWIDVTVIEAPDASALPIERIAAEVAQTQGFRETICRPEGNFSPKLVPQKLPAEGSWSVTSGDVIVVTGGGKGITAECALALAKTTGVRLAIIGRSAAESDEELARNLERLSAVTQVHYARADITSAEQVSGALAEVRAELGSIAGLLHGASINVPALLGDLDEAALQKTSAVKTGGLSHLLDAMAGDELKLLISFGSIIGQSGMRGEAHYAVANEQLRALTRRYAEEHDRCHCLTMEWSVWAGTGMGERLGQIDALLRQGVQPIPIDRGVELFLQLAERAASLPDAVVITGRYGDLPTLRFAEPSIELLRFIDDIKIHIPGVELVSDTVISAATDPFLVDHIFRGQIVVPGVMALEAMAQAARMITKQQAPPVFDDIRFARPMIVPQQGSLVLRVAALVETDGSVRAVVRSADSDFRVDCVSARLRPAHDDEGWNTLDTSTDEQANQLSAERVYGSLLFHEGRFRPIETFCDVMPNSCRAVISQQSHGDWFAAHLPRQLLLGDPAINDAAIHAYQPCIPHRPLLPHSIEQIRFRQAGAAPHTITVRESERDGSAVVVDVHVVDATGRVWQSWRGLRLSTVAGAYYEGPWDSELLGNYITHGVADALGHRSMRAAVVNGATRHDPDARDAAITRIAGGATAVRRPDGKPELNDGRFLSLSYDKALTFITVAEARVGCDIETVQARDETTWQSLVGDAGMSLVKLASEELGCSPSAAATLVWCSREALRKAGGGINTTAQWLGRSDNGWACFGANSIRVAATTVTLAESDSELGIAVAVEGQEASCR